jgi:hypothetical protein
MAALIKDNVLISHTGGAQLHSTFAWGKHGSLKHKRRIDAWLNKIPPNDDLEDPAIACQITTDIYKDWVDWSKENCVELALYFLTNLSDAFARWALGTIVCYTRYAILPYFSMAQNLSR